VRMMSTARQRGLTLLELTVTLLILAMLTTVALKSTSGLLPVVPGFGGCLGIIGGHKKAQPKPGFLYGVPRGIRTPVAAVKGRCPGPLDDGDGTR
jgi:prepilin-type N-terminal cleavage/methylation domain-containing protein